MVESGVSVLLFFADTGAEHPLWDEDGHLWDLEELPLTDELRRELEAWAAEASWPDSYLHDSARLDELKAIGQALCRRTADELGSDFVVRWTWQA
jgi:hypothetical protein